MTFHLTCVHNIFSSVSVAGWPPFGGGCSLGWRCVLLVFWLCVILVISRFAFEGWIWILIASVPDLCIHFTFLMLALRALFCFLVRVWFHGKSPLSDPNF